MLPPNAHPNRQSSYSLAVNPPPRLSSSRRTASHALSTYSTHSRRERSATAEDEDEEGRGDEEYEGDEAYEEDEEDEALNEELRREMDLEDMEGRERGLEETLEKLGFGMSFVLGGLDAGSG
jgi:hypothetical protein